MSLYRGLFVKASSVPDLNVNHSEGLFEFGKDAAMVYVAAGLNLATVATAGKEKVAILQITGAGVISIKYSAEVAVGSGLAVYPVLDSGNLMLAFIGTAAAPITNATTAITNAMINNKVEHEEFGGR
jgi:hypothetical protein